MPRSSHLLRALAALLVLSGCGDCASSPVGRVTTELRAESADLDLGSVYLGAERRGQVLVRNLSPAPVHLERLDLSPSDAFLLETTLPLSVAGGSTLGLVVRFRPPAAGPHAATLSVESTADAGARLAIALRGEGLAPPSCDDANVCTSERFDVSAGVCRMELRRGACDDGSLCTERDECVEGVCMGVGRACDDGNPCTLDLCDPVRGCDHPLDVARCDDRDPCTADACDPATGGCSRSNAPDGTSCGRIDGCTSLSLCVAGACRPFPVPDGFPCFDGDLCTVGDRCVDGACVAQRGREPPRVETLLTRYGGWYSSALLLSPTRLVVADPPVLTVLDIAADGRLVTVKRTLVEAAGVSSKEQAVLALLPDGRLLVGVRAPSAGGTTHALLVYRVLGDGTLELVAQGRGNAPMPGGVQPAAPKVLAIGEVVLACGTTLEAYDLAGGAATLVPAARDLGASPWGDLTCSGMWLESPGVLRVLLSDDDGRRSAARFDVADPARPVRLDSDTDTAWNEVVAVANGRMVRGTDHGWEVIDLATGAVVGAHAWFDVAYGGGTCIGGQAVFQLAGRRQPGGSTAWSVDAYERDGVGQFALVASHEVFAGFDAGITRIRCEGGLVVAASGGQTMLFDVRTPSAPRLLSGDEQGPLSAVRVTGAQALAAGTDGVFPAAQSNGTWAWQAPRRVHARLDVALQRGGAADPSFASVSIPRRNGPANIWDVSDPAAPRLATSTLPSDAYIQSTSRALVAFSQQAGPQRVLRLPFDGPWPPPPALAADAEWALDFPIDGLQAHGLSVSKDGSRVVRFTGSSSGTTRFAVAALAEGGFTFLGQGSVAGAVVDARASGDALVTLQTAAGEERLLALHSVDAASGSISNGPQLGVGAARRILAFDGRTAVVALSDRIRFVDVSVPAPALLGDVPMVQEVIDVDFAGDSLLAVSPNALGVVSPPCPPAP